MNKELLAGLLGRDERVFWTGRPEPRLLTRQMLPRVLLFFITIPFMVFWMVMAMIGGRNKWDQGRVVAPFAAHNVFIAAFIGGLILLGHLHELLSRVADWIKASKSVYLLTNQRAILLRQRRGGQLSHQAHSLALIRLVENGDGSGILMFEGLVGKGKPLRETGFLALTSVREVASVLDEIRSGIRCGTDPVGEEIASG